MTKPKERTFELQWGGVAYWAESFEDNVGGATGVELYRLLDGKQALVAKLIYWDATGQYWLETLGVDLPLGVINKLIESTKTLVGVDVVGPS